VFWICGTFYRKGKAHCNAQQIPEAILQDAAARAMGLPSFDEAIFSKTVESIRTPENDVLVFSMQDGREVRVEWQNKSRRESWTPEMREAARERLLMRMQKSEVAEQ
jgi:hypothetical protein